MSLVILGIYTHWHSVPDPGEQEPDERLEQVQTDSDGNGGSCQNVRADICVFENLQIYQVCILCAVLC